MKRLTKKHRLIWTDLKVIKLDYTKEHKSLSVTLLSDNANCFEADTLQEVKVKIIDLDLISAALYCDL